MIKGNVIILPWHLIFSLPKSTHWSLHLYLILKRHFNNLSNNCKTEGTHKHYSENKRAFSHSHLAHKRPMWLKRWRSSPWGEPEWLCRAIHYLCKEFQNVQSAFTYIIIYFILTILTTIPCVVLMAGIFLLPLLDTWFVQPQRDWYLVRYPVYRSFVPLRCIRSRVIQLQPSGQIWSTACFCK